MYNNAHFRKRGFYFTCITMQVLEEGFTFYTYYNASFRRRVYILHVYLHILQCKFQKKGLYFTCIIMQVSEEGFISYVYNNGHFRRRITLCINAEETGIAQWLERQTHDRNVLTRIST